MKVPEAAGPGFHLPRPLPVRARALAAWAPQAGCRHQRPPEDASHARTEGLLAICSLDPTIMKSRVELFLPAPEEAWLPVGRTLADHGHRRRPQGPSEEHLQGGPAPPWGGGHAHGWSEVVMGIRLRSSAAASPEHVDSASPTAGGPQQVPGWVLKALSVLGSQRHPSRRPRPGCCLIEVPSSPSQHILPRGSEPPRPMQGTPRSSLRSLLRGWIPDPGLNSLPTSSPWTFQKHHLEPKAALIPPSALLPAYCQSLKVSLRF